jgi:hypothetical protein
MEAALGLRDLKEEIDTLPDADEILHIDLKGRDPDEGSTDIPYEKGALFLRHLEETFGRARFDQFLKSYFDHFAFQSITTDQFVDYLNKNLLDASPELAKKVPVAEWIMKPGLPDNAPKPTSPAFAQVEKQVQRWLSKEIPASSIPTAKWTTQEWLHFLRTVQDSLEPPAAGADASPAAQTQLSQTEKVGLMAELDRAFKLTRVGNSEIAFQWLLMSIRNHYEPAYPRLEEFLLTIGRRKFIKPLYEELAKTPEGKERAMAIYRRARPTYHPIAVASIDDVLKWAGD